MAGTRRSSPAFFIHLSRVVTPRLDVDAAYLGMDSVEWDSGTEDEIPGGQNQEWSPKTRAKVGAAAKKSEEGADVCVRLRGK